MAISKKQNMKQKEVHILYFAYGSNLNLDQMKKRCPEFKKIGYGILKNYLWFISKRGYANIVPSENDEVHGIIYDLSESDIDNLDIKEGVTSGCYSKNFLIVECNRFPFKCLVYVDSTQTPGVPKTEYITRINQGIMDSKLSPDYISKTIRKYIPE